MMQIFVKKHDAAVMWSSLIIFPSTVNKSSPSPAFTNVCTNRLRIPLIMHVRSLLYNWIWKFSSLFCSIIGTPSQSDWPSSVSLARSSFPRYVSFSLVELIPEMCSSGTHLLKVIETKKCTPQTHILGTWNTV